MRDDLEKILKGPNSQEKNFYVLCALTDFKNLLKECQKPKQHNTTGGGGKFWLAPFDDLVINFFDSFQQTVSRLQLSPGAARDQREN